MSLLAIAERRDGWPSWSPDGRTIAVDGAPAFSGFAPWQELLELPRKLYLYSVDTGKLRPILDGFIAAGVPVWSPDGQQVAIATSPPDTRVSGDNNGGSRGGAPLPNTLYVLDASHLEELAAERCSP